MHSDFEERKYGGLSKNDVVSIVRLEVRHIDNLAQALFEEWHDFAPWSSVDKIRSYYHECLRDDNLPLSVILMYCWVRRHSNGITLLRSRNMNIGWAMSLCFPSTVEKVWADAWLRIV